MTRCIDTSSDIDRYIATTQHLISNCLRRPLRSVSNRYFIALSRFIDATIYLSVRAHNFCCRIKIFSKILNLVFFFHYIWSVCYFELKINFYVENSISKPPGSMIFYKMLIEMFIIKRIELFINLD